MKDLIQAVYARRTMLRRLEEELQEKRLGVVATETVKQAGFLIDVLVSVLNGNTVLKAFGAPGDWGYGTPIGDALLEALKHDDVLERARKRGRKQAALEDPYRWHDLQAEPNDLPDAEIQVLAYDGERHHLAHLADDEGGDQTIVWMDSASDEPLAFSIVRWRHLDDGDP